MSLALTRKPGESIQIGHDILVTVVSVEGNRVKLAIDAPQSVHIMRTELVVRPEKRDDTER